MTTFGVGMFKDEADIAGHTIEHMLGQVDDIIVIDNGSTDGTREILAEFPITVIDDNGIAYHQSDRMNRLAAQAAADGADWVVPFDADEWWYCPHADRIADRLVDLGRFAVVRAGLYDHRATAADPDEPNPFWRMGWRNRKSGPLPKVAFRPVLTARLGMGNHAVEYPRVDAVEGELVVRHFPYRSVDQFVSKVRNGAAAMAATTMPEATCAHWRRYGAILDAGGPAGIEEIFRKWFWFDRPDQRQDLIFDPAP